MTNDDVLHVWINAPRVERGSHVYSAMLERRSAEPRELWLRVPEEHAGLVTRRADPFAILSVFSAMKARCRTIVHGEVSPSLLRNLEEFQAVWAAWRPELYGAVEITADVEREDASPGPAGRAIVAFSGGVDAAFTAYRHQRRLCGRRSRTIGAGVMIQGYDVPARDDAMFAPAYRRAHTMARSLGVMLIPVATNYREVEPLWEDVHAACVVSCLALFAKGYGAALLGSSEPYRALIFPWASNPVTDPLLSSASFPVLHDGAEVDRVAKIRVLSEWEEAGQNLFVCWEPTADGENCGRCNKCIRTILDYRVLGLPRPAGFSRDVDDAQIAGMGLLGLNDTKVNDLEVILRAASAGNITAPWVPALRRVVRRYTWRKRVGRLPWVQGLRTALDSNPVGRRVWDLVRRR